MKKNEIFSFTAPNGVEVTGIVVDIIKDDRDYQWYLCYAQNRIFHYQEIAGLAKPIVTVGVDYAILPDYDAALEMAGFDEEEADILFERDNHAQAINKVKAMGYNEKEAINILEGKNADGSNFEELPF